MPRITAEVIAPPAPWMNRARDQHDLALGEPAGGRGGDEDRQADDEDPPLSDQVAEPSGEQQQAAEGDQVGVDDPGEVRLREAEIVLDRGQGDVHDRLVEDDHQHPDAEDDEGDPTGAAARVRALGTVNRVRARLTWIEDPGHMAPRPAC